MRRLVIIMTFYLISTVAFAQQNSAALEFFDGLVDCAASLGGWKCLELDLSSEVVEEKDSTKFYEYSWNFGDGNRLQGTTIEHCYEDFGSYQVSMDLLDLETNTVIRNELSATVHLYPEIFPAVDVNTEDQNPGFIRFSYSDKSDGSFTPDKVFWRIDGTLYEGISIVHSFPVAGVYLVEMGVEKDMGFLGSVSACATKEVTISESDVWTSNMRRIIQEKRNMSNIGPFATDEIFCRITDVSSTDLNSSVMALDGLMSQVRLEEGKMYEILIFSGNVFSERGMFVTAGMSGNKMYHALKDSVNALVRKPLTMLILPGKTNEESDTVELEPLVRLLHQHPYFEIMIGTYLHSGSRVSRGMEASIARSAGIRDALVKAGISPERISVASPEFNRSLVNTCSALPDCDWEDEALDGKVELKITGCL